MPRADLRKTLNSVLYILINGCRWADLPRNTDIYTSKSSAHPPRHGACGDVGVVRGLHVGYGHVVVHPRREEVVHGVCRHGGVAQADIDRLCGVEAHDPRACPKGCGVPGRCPRRDGDLVRAAGL
jgi:hypothetical protein